MSCFEITVDGEEFISGLSKKEKQLLVQYLKVDLKEDFDVPIENPVPRGVEADVYVDLDFALFRLNSYERKELYDELSNEFDEPNEPPTIEQLFASGTTHTEFEFGMVLKQLWEDRGMLTNEQKAKIVAITKESFV